MYILEKHAEHFLGIAPSRVHVAILYFFRWVLLSIKHSGMDSGKPDLHLRFALAG